MNHPRVAFLAICLLLSLRAPGLGQQSNKDDAMKDCPMHKENASVNPHQRIVEKHGDQAMGFSHETTTHHFRLSAEGGRIEVKANDVTDKPAAEAIRSHLSHIAIMFQGGDFSTPAFVDDGIPPGVTTMKILKEKIRYQYEEVAAGARVRIESSDPIAVAAIQDFFRFQINDHQTGDPLEVDSVR